jgi:predicted transcriptional regulator
MARKGKPENLSRRERQIMDVIYRCGKAAATEVMDELPNPPGNATVRKLLRILEEKGHLRHRKEGNRYVYFPTVSADKAKASAMKHLLDTFFKGSAAGAVVALLDMSEGELSDSESETILELIEKSKKEGR